MRSLVLASLFVLGCSRPAPVADRVEAGAVVGTAAPLPVIDAAPAARTKHFRASLAHFVKNQLFECIDLSMDLEPPADAGADWKPPDNPTDTVRKSMSKELTPIQDPCGVAFADRTVLATCSHAHKGDAGSGEVNTSFYGYDDIGLSDEQMADCLKGKGRWNALARDSLEFRKAKLDYDSRNLRKAVGKLNAAAAQEDQQ